MTRSFEDLAAEAAEAPTEGWDFAWLDGRATEERPPWGYARQIAARLPCVGAALDIQTGGGEVLAGVPVFPPRMVATEAWPPNVAKARARLGSRGVAVVAADDRELPFAPESFDLVVSRHPVPVWWNEIARVLRPGGSYLSQQVGPATQRETLAYFLGPGAAPSGLDPDAAVAAARAAGLEIVELQLASCEVAFYDIGAIIYFLRKVIWLIPDFSVERYRDKLEALHVQLERGPFIAHANRFLLEARKS